MKQVKVKNTDKVKIKKEHDPLIDAVMLKIWFYAGLGTIIFIGVPTLLVALVLWIQG